MRTVMRSTFLLVAIVAIAGLASCGGDAPEPEPMTPTAVPTATRADIGQRVAIPTDLPSTQAARMQLRYPEGARDSDPRPLEEIILESEVIARVGYLHHLGSVTSARWGWVALLEFRFEVREYLKGSGPDEIGAFIFAYYETAVAARRATTLLAAAHDGRWDNREAVVFLNYGAEHIAPEIQLGEGQFWLARMDADWGEYEDAYSLASGVSKLWLPEATQPPLSGRAALTETSMPQSFMLDVPSETPCCCVPSGPTMSLVDLRSKITALEAEANAGGTLEYRRCVEEYYRALRTTRESVAHRGHIGWRHSNSIDSGLPMGTVVDEYPGFAESPGIDGSARHWYEGPDRDLMRYSYVDYVTSTRRTVSYEYTLQLVTARPLPAGTYTFFPNWGRTETCGKDWSFMSNRSLHTLTVTAPPGTLHEAFFDPVVIGDAVGVEAGHGVIKPVLFALNGSTTAISSLKWQDGVVSLTTGPADADLDDYVLDFIDMTGATTLSLAFADASAGAWAVADAPWADGDQLMLRLWRARP